MFTYSLFFFSFFAYLNLKCPYRKRSPALHKEDAKIASEVAAAAGMIDEQSWRLQPTSRFRGIKLYYVLRTRCASFSRLFSLFCLFWKKKQTFEDLIDERFQKNARCVLNSALRTDRP